MAWLFRPHKKVVGFKWRIDETYIRIKDQWKYLYRAVDQYGHTIDFLLTAQRDVAAARRFLEQAINQHDIPDSITIDKSGANTAAIYSVNEDTGLNIKLRQFKYLNNLVEQDHRAIKRRTRPMLGFKSFATATKLLAGIELARMLRKGQMKSADGQVTSAASQFYSLAY